MSVTEFYFGTPSSSNLCAGSSAGAAVYTSTSGNWDGTSVFTPTDSSTPSSTVSVGMWLSVYPNANSATNYSAKITAVGAGVNGTITAPATNSFGSVPSSSTGGVSCKAGGAWADHGMVASGACLNTGAVTQSTRINCQAGTVANTTTSRTFALAGTAAFPLIWRGYQTTIGDQDGVANVVAGTNVPLWTWTTGGLTISGNYQTFNSMAWTFAGTSSSIAVSISGTALNTRLYGVNIATTNSNAGSSAMQLLTDGANLTFCNISAPTTAAQVISIAGNVYVTGCIISGGIVGIKGTTGTQVIIDGCFLSGQAGDSVQFTTGTTLVRSSAIYNTSGNGINMSSTGELHVDSCYFEGMPSPKFAINNSSGTNTGKMFPMANSYYNVNGMVNGAGDFPLILDNGTLASSGLTNAAGGNFTPTSVLYALGFPGKFLNSTVVGYPDGGAAQHQSQLGLTGQIMRVFGQTMVVGN